MTKIKTLKDLKQKNNPECLPQDNPVLDIGDYVEIKDLRQEAIKWIKEFQRRGEPKIRGERTTGEVGNFYKIDAFKEFFNITDEELKGFSEDIDKCQRKTEKLVLESMQGLKERGETFEKAIKKLKGGEEYGEN